MPLMPPPGFGVAPILPDYYSRVEAQDTRRASRWLASLVAVAEKRGIAASRLLIRGRRSVAEELAMRAMDEGADLIVVGTNPRGALEKLILGSTSRALLNQAECPVLVVH
jgi:nucleotide-binding universal stress UspA family protein